jgi:hypothetical protein
MSDEYTQEFADYETLGEARQWLRQMATGKGAQCPCCRQNTKIYHRAINATQAAVLIKCYRRVGRADFKLSSTIETPGGDYAKLRYWNLIERVPGTREDGGPGGWWRITEVGERWVRGEIGVPRYVYVYDNERLRFDREAEQEWTVRDALGSKFDYSQLMNDPGLTTLPV